MSARQLGAIDPGKQGRLTCAALRKTRHAEVGVDRPCQPSATISNTLSIKETPLYQELPIRKGAETFQVSRIKGIGSAARTHADAIDKKEVDGRRMGHTMFSKKNRRWSVDQRLSW
jgi:hypothetical protein